MAKKDRERRKMKIASAANWASKSKDGGFERTAVELPEGVNFFSPKKEGTYRLEIIPYEVKKRNPNAKPGEMYCELTYFNHPRIGVDNNSYVCLQRTFGKKCPICEYRIKLDKRGEDEELVKALLPKQRQLFNIFDHNEPEKGVQVWEISHHNFGKHLAKKIRGADEEDRERYERFFDPGKRGYTLRINATEESMGKNDFLVFTDIEFRDRKEPLDPALLDEAVCLEDCLIEKDYDELKKILMQTPDDEDEPKKKKKRKDDDDEEDSEDDEGDEEESEEDDNEDSEDDEDEEDDESDSDDKEGDFSIGDKVDYIYRGKRKSGKIKKINKDKDIAGVDIGEDKLQWVDMDELLEPKKKWDESEDEDGNEDEDAEDEESEEDDEDSEDEEEDDSEDDEGSEEEDEETDEDDEPIDEDEPAPKKRGRPKGSKNKKKDDDDD